MPACQRGNVSRLELVGSAASGDFDPTKSDVDFLVDFMDVPDFDYFTAYMDLRKELVGIVGREVDLITARGIENPYLKASLARDALVLYRSCP